MSKKLNKVLIIGGGFAGMSTAIQLLKADVEVHIVERSPNWTADGAGITIGGPTLRAIETLGLLDKYLANGFAANGVDTFKADGEFMARIKTPSAEGTNVPSNGGIMRPVLGNMMADEVIKLGGNVRVDCTYTAIDDQGAHVAVKFTDGSSGEYDIVVASDGLFSQTRELVFPEAQKPAYTGQGVWRAVFKRPASIETTTIWHNAEARMKMGVNPVSDTHMYMFLNDSRPTNDFIEAEDQLGILKELLQNFPNEQVKALAEELGEHSQVLYRPLEGMLLPLPWSKGNVILIGDAVHATTPHLAMGAGLGIEDGIVLAEELLKGDNITETFTRFENRRWERARLVVENSKELGELEKAGGDKATHTKLFQDSILALIKTI